MWVYGGWPEHHGAVGGMMWNIQGGWAICIMMFLVSPACLNFVNLYKTLAVCVQFPQTFIKLQLCMHTLFLSMQVCSFKPMH